MEAVFVLRDKLRSLYAWADFIILPLLKLLCSVVFLLILRDYLGFEGRAAGWKLIGLLSLPCALFPAGCISLSAAVYLLIGFYGLSVTHAAIAFAVFFLIIVLYFGFAPGMGVLLALVPVSFIMGIPFAVPVILGMSLGLTSAVPAALGVFLFYLLRYLKTQAAGGSAFSTELIRALAENAKAIFMNKEMLMVIFAFVLCIIVVYFISNSGMPHAWSIAVGAGLVTLAALMLFAASYQNEKGLSADLIGLVLSALICFAYEYLFYQVDYARTEHLHIEDDEYFYYIKAIPKVKPYDESLRRE